MPPITHLGAQGPEKIILARLTGIKFVSAADQVVKTGVSLTGVDVSAVPLLRKSDFPEVLKLFLDHPASFESLQRIVVATSTYLEASGYPFLTIYLPQQDITGGAVQVVVTVGRAEDIVKVKGAKYFNERQYRAAIRQRPGEPIDTTDLQADVDWLNRNPFRHVTTIAAPGAKVGSTDLELRVDERLPLRLTAGYNNTGSLVSDEDRVFAGITWGNAFGRGDQLGYQYSASPDARTSVTHSGNYSTDLPWRHTLSVFGAYSELVGRVSAPLSLKGHNGQLGLRYAIPLRPLRPKVTQDLTLGFDFKSSDNNLLFAEFPITDNLTQIAQFTAAYDLGFTDRWGGTSLGVNLFVSPGGLTSRNHGRYFAISRAGARADYVYGQLTAQRQTRLPRGFTWSIRGVLQLSSANLLGSEQMVGGGAGSVRGYEEGEAYGDQGLFVSHEIGLPVKSVTRLFRAARWSDSLQAFAFEDFAVQASKDRLPGERRSTVLHSLGVGLRYQLRQNLSVDLSQGWQLRESGVSRSGDHARTHISVQASY
ncbi:MAG TPA: ShlB/FhaC/HecB family hemolysin secretion/activation protein [Opitutus sp.]|nr:ShlB/FhaC/HecB family hemolysin secretion/activation protein [Opitutus sp.]